MSVVLYLKPLSKTRLVVRGETETQLIPLKSGS